MKIPIIFVALLVFFSCTKFGKTDTVKGKVLNHITGEGVNNVSIVLLKEETKLFGGSKIIKETLSDNEGSFEISAGKLKGLEASIVDDGKYFILGWYQDGQLISEKYSNRISLKKGKTLIADFHVLNFGMYKLNFQNVNCEGDTDTMVFRYKSEYDADYSIFFPEKIGCVSEVTGEIKHPQGKYFFEIQVRRVSGVQTYFFEFVNNPNQIDTFDLFY